MAAANSSPDYRSAVADADPAREPAIPGPLGDQPRRQYLQPALHLREDGSVSHRRRRRHLASQDRAQGRRRAAGAGGILPRGYFHAATVSRAASCATARRGWRRAEYRTQGRWLDATAATIARRCAAGAKENGAEQDRSIRAIAD